MGQSKSSIIEGNEGESIISLFSPFVPVPFRLPSFNVDLRCFRLDAPRFSADFCGGIFLQEVTEAKEESLCGLRSQRFRFSKFDVKDNTALESRLKK